MTLTEFLLARIAEDKADPRHGLHGWVNGKKVPGRWARECEAKLRAVEAAWKTELDMDAEFGQGSTREQMAERGLDPDVVYALAAVYADHPDYLSVWRP